LPVFYDMEDADDYKANHDFDFSKENCTAVCQSFISNIGLNCGIYASYDWLTNSIDWQSLECPVWNAEWGGQDDLQGYMWQDTSSAMIDGNRFDQDWLY
jgi:lysozyme